MIRKKLALTIGSLGLIMLISSYMYVSLVTRIEKDVSRLADIEEPLKAAIQEIEIATGESYTQILDYAQRMKADSLTALSVSQNKTHALLKNIKGRAQTKEMRKLCSDLETLQKEFEAVGEKVVLLTDKQHADLVSLREKVKEINGLIRGGLYKKLDKFSPDAGPKLEALLNMELHIKSTFAALESYMVLRERSLRKAASTSLDRFRKHMRAYRATGLWTSEERLLQRINKAFSVSARHAGRILDQEDAKLKQLERFEQERLDIDSLLNRKIQPLIRSGVIVAKESARADSAKAKLLLVLTVIVGLVGGLVAWLIASAIISSIRTLKEGAEKIGQGHLDHKIVIRSSDELGHLAASFNRMTEKRKTAEEELMLASKVFEAAAEGVVVTDTMGVIQSVNPAFLAITGYTEEDVAGKTPWFLKSDRHEKKFYVHALESLRSNGTWKGEIWQRGKDGTETPAWVTVSAIKNDNGEPIQYAALISDISKIKKSEEEVKYQAYHDALTRLPNRLLFKDRLTHAISLAEREGTLLAVLFLDLDDFKKINDSMGHSTGDLLLQGMAARLLDCLREVDTVSRFGGDEFTILLENINDEREAVTAAQRIIQALAEPYCYGDEDFYSTTSVGVALYPNDGKEVDELIKNADLAMYHAKELGKNNYQFFSQAMNEELVKRVEIENDLRKAIDRNEMVAYYQPKVDVHNERIIGMEALSRWRRNGNGAVTSPAEFIPVAEESGLICALGERMLEDACRQTKIWHDEGFDFLKVAVNVSARQLRLLRFPDIVMSILEKTGLKPEYLELEMTESAVMDNIDRAISHMKRLSKAGVRISIDDFGTGYSSLSYLKKFPIDKLKIDRSFVTDILTNQDDCAIAKATISMGHSMGLQVNAEGVENREQLEFLREIGCDELQGYYFGKPAPVDEFREMLVRSAATAGAA